MQLDAARDGGPGPERGKAWPGAGGGSQSEESDQFKDEHHKFLRWQERRGEGERRRVRKGEHHMLREGARD